MKDNNWIVLVTTPPTPQDEFDQIVVALSEAGLALELTENQARQCKNDVAFWLNVHLDDLTLAWQVVRRLENR